MGLALALGLRRLRAWHRVWWHRLTGRWPRCKQKPMDGGRPCTEGEARASRALIRSWQRKDAAGVADYDRKRQP